MNKEASPNVAPAIIRSAEPSPPQDNVVEVKTTPAAIIGRLCLLHRALQY